MVAPRPAEYYRERSQHFLNLIDAVLDLGELELACEVSWGASAHAIKAVAQRKGWEHGSHDRLRATVIRLIGEGAPPYLKGQYMMASEFHIGFYGDRVFDADNIRVGRELIAQFIQTLESLP